MKSPLIFHKFSSKKQLVQKMGKNVFFFTFFGKSKRLGFRNLNVDYSFLLCK